jgi:hypothetical protein
MARLRYSKEKQLIPNPKHWLKNTYRMHLAKQILPMQQKDKQSPHIGPDPISPALPKCQVLDSVERGKINMFRARAPSAWDQDDPSATNEIKLSISV